MLHKNPDLLLTWGFLCEWGNGNKKLISAPLDFQMFVAQVFLLPEVNLPPHLNEHTVTAAGHDQVLHPQYIKRV